MNSELKWIFVYGGLMWKPPFAFKDKQRATLQGFHRAFCIQAMVWRGTRECPGWVLGLEPGGSCEGIAYEFMNGQESTSVRETDAIELQRDVYHRVPGEVLLADGRKVMAHAYVANLLSAERKTDTLLEKAKMISKAVGKSGSAIEYLVNAREQLARIGISDPYIEEMFVAVQSLIKVPNPRFD